MIAFVPADAEAYAIGKKELMATAEAQLESASKSAAEIVTVAHQPALE